MQKTFLENTTFIRYNEKEHTTNTYEKIEDINLTQKNAHVYWVNTYGIDYQEELRQVIIQNNLDDFLLKLIKDDEQSNKVIELDGIFFISIRILKTENEALDSEQMFFIVSSDFVWCIQEHDGDYFDWIRERIRDNKGIIRKKESRLFTFFLDRIYY